MMAVATPNGRVLRSVTRHLGWPTVLPMRDTEAHALEAQLAAVRRLGPAGRVRLAVAMSEDARRISFEAERRRHPELDAAAARRAVLRRIWGVDLAARVDAAARGR